MDYGEIMWETRAGKKRTIVCANGAELQEWVAKLRRTDEFFVVFPGILPIPKNGQ